jgi:hypothetical protein
MTDQELSEWAKAARHRASAHGPLHGLWDLIFDAEAHAHGEQALLDRPTVEAMVQQNINENRGTL